MKFSEIKMGKEVIEEVRYFLEAASKQFEKKGIYLQRVHFNRNDAGVCQYVELSYEERAVEEPIKTDEL